MKLYLPATDSSHALDDLQGFADPPMIDSWPLPEDVHMSDGLDEITVPTTPNRAKPMAQCGVAQLTDTRSPTNFPRSSLQSMHASISSQTDEALVQPAQPERRHNKHCLEAVLQVASRLRTDESCSAARLGAGIRPGNDQTRTVDQVLILNKKALQVLHQTLSCSCSADEDVLLACCLATSKVLFWYRIVIGDGDAGNHAISPLIKAPLRIGQYALSTSAIRAVLARVVLSELRDHVQPLLAQLPKHQISPAGRDPWLAPGTVEGLLCQVREDVRNLTVTARGMIHPQIVT
jgi:hypothetical protein